MNRWLASSVIMAAVGMACPAKAWTLRDYPCFPMVHIYNTDREAYYDELSLYWPPVIEEAKVLEVKEIEGIPFDGTLDSMQMEAIGRKAIQLCAHNLATSSYDAVRRVVLGNLYKPLKERPPPQKPSTEDRSSSLVAGALPPTPSGKEQLSAEEQRRYIQMLDSNCAALLELGKTDKPSFDSIEAVRIYYHTKARPSGSPAWFISLCKEHPDLTVRQVIFGRDVPHGECMPRNAPLETYVMYNGRYCDAPQGRVIPRATPMGPTGSWSTKNPPAGSPPSVFNLDLSHPWRQR